jgi:hypothetical protein
MKKLSLYKGDFVECYNGTGGKVADVDFATYDIVFENGLLEHWRNIRKVNGDFVDVDSYCDINFYN